MNYVVEMEKSLDKQRARIAELEAELANTRFVMDKRGDAVDLLRANLSVSEERQAALRAVLEDLTFADNCQYDCNGFCQAHNWFKVEPRCPQARAKEALGYALAPKEREGVKE